MGDKLRLIGSIFEIPMGIVKRRLDLKLHKKERLPKESFNKWLYERIKSSEAAAIVRFGGTEMKSLRKYELNRVFNLKLDMSSEVSKLCALSGFFPNDVSLIDEFCILNIDMLPEIDAIGTWDLAFERYFIKKYMVKDVVQTELENLEPYFCDAPWSKALEGKKVLVVHPFADSIKAQYENNREKLFKNKDVLPSFELKCVKAVQSLGGVPDGDYKDWFEAYESMLQKIKEVDFDVAILGCGAYGMPLAINIKRMGKIAIHLGGATQMMFGVYGKRWEDNGDGLINEHWIRPLESEKSVNFNKVENGCYW